MGYSWRRFAIGVVLGTAGFALLFADTSYLLAWFLLILVANSLLVQAAEPDEDETEAKSDAEEWRETGRALFTFPRELVLPILQGLALMFAWDLVVRRYALLGDLARDFGPLAAVTVLAILWVRGVVVRFRDGKRRRLSVSAPASRVRTS